MADKIKGILIEIGGDTSGLQKALKTVNSQSSNLTKELKGINSLLKFDPKNTELLAQKQTVLNRNIDVTQQKLNELKKIKEEADKKMASGTKISEENYRNLQREIINTEKKLSNLTQNLKDFNLANSNLTKAGKVVEEYGNKISKASSKVSDLGNKTSILSATTVAGGTVLSNTAMSLESSVSKYISATNVAEEESKKYKEILEDIYNKNYGETYDDIADAMTQVKNQLKDIDAQNLQNVTEKALALRDIFGYDVSESVRAVKALMDNFNISADEAFNLISQGKQQGLDFSNEMLDNINEYSVQFKKLGLTADDMFNIFKTGSENGAFNLDKIGDAVKEFSIRAIDGSNTTIDGFKKIGLNADEMAKKFAQGGDGAKQAFIEVINRIGKMDNKVQQSIVGVDLFGTMWEDLGPTVITSFSKMDNGISKSNDSMQKSIDELYNTTQKKAEAQLKRLKSIGADFGEEMLPTLEKLIDMAEDFTQKLEGMSEAEKENLLKIIMLVAGIGPFTKTLGTAGIVVGSTTKGISILSQALGVLKTGGTSSSVSVNTLAKMLGAVTSPLGLVTLGVTGLAGAMWFLGQRADESVVKSEEQINTLNKQKQAIQSIKSAQEEYLNANVSEIENVKTLKDELLTLVDANGQVKEGYKGRVSFILSELNKALGTEYTLTGDIVDKYKELTSSIDETIEKKKASIILNSMEESYTNALKNRSEAIKNLANLEKTYASDKQKISEKEQELQDTLKKKQDIFTLSRAHQLKEEIETLKGNVNAYDEQKNAIIGYNKTIDEYEKTSATIKEGNLDKIREINENYTNSYRNRKDSTIQSLTEQLEYEKVNIQTLKETYNQNQSEITQKQIEESNNRLNALGEELVNSTSTIQDLTPEQANAWKVLSEAGYEQYSYYVSKLSPEMQQKIQEATGVIAGGTPEMQAVAGELGRKTIEEFDKSADSRQKALNTITGYLNGLNDEQKREFLRQAGIENADAVINELDKGNLSEENGKNILKGLYNGLSNGSWKDKIIGVASGLAKAVNKAFTGKDGWDEHSPSKKMQKFTEYYIQPISDVMKKKQARIVSNAQELANRINSQFAGKFNEVDMNNFNKNLSGSYIKNSSKNISNTNNININVKELDQARLEQCFNYLNEKFGILYN